MKAIILGGDEKPLINFKNRPLISYTTNALIQLEIIDYILVVGNKKLLTPIIGGNVNKIVDQENNILDNLIKGISHLKKEEKVLVITSDIPLITTNAIKHFISNALNFKADIYYPIIEKSLYQTKYPNIKRTYVSLKEGDFTGGNLAIINPQKIQYVENQIRPLIEYRKNPFKMAKVLGMSITKQLLLKQLTVKKVETYIKQTFGITAKALISPYPEIATDIDNIKHIKILEKYI